MNRQPLPWAISAVSLLVAAVSVFAALRLGPEPSAGVAEVGAPSEEVQRLRRHVALLESEGLSLRAELDRLRRSLQARRTMEAQQAASGDDRLSPEEKRERLATALGRLRDIVPRLSSGGEAVFAEMRDVFLGMARAPMDDPTLFRKAYEEAADPLTKTILLPHLLARDREGSADLLKRELAENDDPQLRSAILERLRFSTDVAADPEAQRAYLSALEGGESPRARQAAVAALSAVPSPDVEQALLEVAGADPDPETREAAIRQLAENPRTRPQLLQALANEPDERLRKVGECTAALAPPVP
ncbi:MAG: HEAT repeat domain-containing protein [Candidatus Binatia bacterium]